MCNIISSSLCAVLSVKTNSEGVYSLLSKVGHQLLEYTFCQYTFGHLLVEYTCSSQGPDICSLSVRTVNTRRAPAGGVYVQHIRLGDLLLKHKMARPNLWEYVHHIGQHTWVRTLEVHVKPYKGQIPRPHASPPHPIFEYTRGDQNSDQIFYILEPSLWPIEVVLIQWQLASCLWWATSAQR